MGRNVRQALNSNTQCMIEFDDEEYKDEMEQ
jgi:hypothetical protein